MPLSADLESALCVSHSPFQQMAGSCCDFTILPFFSGIQARVYVYIYTITASCIACCQQAKNHISLSHTHIRASNLNQHFFQIALGDAGKLGASIGLADSRFPPPPFYGLKRLSKYSPTTLPYCLGPAGTDFGLLHHSLWCQQILSL